MEKLIGTISHVFGKISVAIVKITDGELHVGDTIHIKGTHTDLTQKVNSMQVEHNQIDVAKKDDEIGLKTDQPVHDKDEVYLVTDD